MLTKDSQEERAIDSNNIENKDASEINNEKGKSKWIRESQVWCWKCKYSAANATKSIQIPLI